MKTSIFSTNSQRDSVVVGNIFHPVKAYLEIKLDGQSQEQAFSDQIEQFGGRCLKVLVKSATHVVWSNGKLQTLLKASEMAIQIVSPLWIKACLEQGKLLDEDAYRPSNLETKLKVIKQEMKNRNGNKKRPAPDSSQLKIFEKKP